MTLQTKLPGSAIQTGTISVTAITNFSGELSASLPPDVVSSSAQVKTFLPTDTVSSSAQVTAFLPTGTVSSSTQLPAGIASSSAQVTAYLPTDTVSSSVQVTAFLPTGTVSSSTQLPSGIASSSAQVIAYLPTGTVSSSTQVDVFTTIGGNTLATTGSNTFTAAQTISDTTNSTSYLDGALHVAGGMSVRKDVRVSGSMTVNGLLTAVSMSTQYVTASEYTIGTSKILLNDDDLVRFAGLSIVDSGSSSPTTASIFWDSLQHRFIYENLSGSSYNSSIIMAGPKHTGTLGDEVGLTDFRVPVAHGSDHIDSRVASSSIRVDFPSRLTHVEAGLYVTGAISASGGAVVGGDLTVDTNTLYVDSTNNRVGIGTISPAVALDVAGNIRLSATGYIGFGGGTNYIEGDNSNNLIKFGTNNTEKMRLDTSGNLGLGVTPKSWATGWKVIDIGANGSLAYTTAGDNDLTLAMNAYYDTTDARWEYKSVTDKAARYSITAAGVHAWYYTNTNGTANGPITFTEAMRIDSSGNVGIGTTSVAARLHVQGGNLTFGKAGNGSNVNGRWMSIEGNTAADGEGSSRIFFSEHNSTTVDMDGYGMSLGYRGGGTSITGASGNTWTGLSQIDNGEWAMFGHDANPTGAVIMRGSRTASYMSIMTTNVGIGTTNPDAKLKINASTQGLCVVSNNAAPAASTMFQVNSQGNDSSTYIAQFGSLNAGIRMVVRSDGNVGIGTASPAQKLHVEGSATIGTTGTEDILILGRALSGGVSFQQAASLKLGRYQNAGGSFESYTRLDIALRDNSAASNYNTNTTVMTLTNAGNVGIGTTNPGNTLDVVASQGYGSYASIQTAANTVVFLKLRSSAEGGARMDFANNATSLTSIQALAADVGNGSYNDGIMTFWTAKDAVLSERMRITYDGDLLVGTTTVNGAGGISLGTSGFLNVDVGFTGTNEGAVFNQSSTGNTQIDFRYQGTPSGYIEWTSTSTAYNTSSDYRLKQNVQPMTNALTKVAQLNPVTFTWKSNGSNGQGFIAHELQEVIPEAVCGEKDGLDDEGKPRYQGVDASFLVATLTKAIQEQQTIIEELKTRITQLETQ